MFFVRTFQTNHSKATERSPMGGGDDNTQLLPILCLLLYSSLVYVSQSEQVAPEVYRWHRSCEQND